MQPSKILETWEECLGQSTVISGLKMATLSLINTEEDALIDWSIEKRDARLFHLRKQLFGHKFENLASCPNCQEQVEWTMDYSDLEVPPPNQIKEGDFNFETKGYSLKFRLPSTRDLLINEENRVLRNCLQSCVKDGSKIDFNEIPQKIKKELIYHIEDESHLSNIVVQLDCKVCSHSWNLNFDIVPYLWAEIDRWAKRFLNQVAVLAKHFGWSEKAIIDMNPNRRTYYLNLLYS